MTEPNTIIIGIDGASPKLIERFSEEGCIPNIKDIIEEGSISKFRSTIPPVTSPAWPSMTTGYNPAKIGICDFINPQNDEVVKRDKVQKEFFWEKLQRNDISCGLVNIPVTYPPYEEFNGFVVTGMLTPTNSQNFTYPEDLLRDPEDYKVTPVSGESNQTDSVKRYDEWKDVHSIQERVNQKLVREEDWDIYMTVFQITDGVGHNYWNDSEKIEEAYKRVDRTIGRLLKHVEDENVILVSDHGFGSLEGIINLNNYFIQEDLLKLKSNKGKNKLFQLGITPKKIYDILCRIKLEKLAYIVPKQIRNNFINKAFANYESIDKQESICFSKGHFGQIHFTDENPKSREHKKARVKESLNTLTKNGRGLDTQIIDMQDLYDGPRSDVLPDLFVSIEDYRYISYPLFAQDNKVFSQHITGMNGTHRRDGVFIAKGPDFEDNDKYQDTQQIFDLAPTLYSIYGEEIPEDMDGSPVKFLKDEAR